MTSSTGSAAPQSPALWAAKGVPAAILAGDALFFAAVHTLAKA
ncbi:hypothetical protein [Streptomyces coeruleorubidus]